MTKSSRSKWKKMTRRERAQSESGNVAKRIVKLHSKLELAAKGGLSNVPMQDAETRFHFTHPEKRKAGEKLVLRGMTTNPHGKSNTKAPHPNTVNYETVAEEAPIAGKARTVEDERRMLQVSAEALQAAVNLAVAEPDFDDDEPVEITIGCNDDEYLNTALAQKALSAQAKLKKATKTATVAPSTAKQELTVAPKAAKIKSMEKQKGITMGDKKIKSEVPTKRLVSGNKKK